MLGRHGQASTSNLKGDLLPELDINRSGFCLRYKHCWPKKTKIDVSGESKEFEFSIDFMLCPGDTVDVEIDYQKAQALKDDKVRLLRAAVKVSGESFPRTEKSMCQRELLRAGSTCKCFDIS